MNCKTTLFSIFTAFFWCLVVVIPTTLKAQEKDKKDLQMMVDSVSVVLENRTQDAKVLPMITRLKNKAVQLKMPYEHANAFLLESNYYFLNSQWHPAIRAAEKALEVSKKIVDPQQKTEIEVKAYNSKGYVYSYQGDFAEALSVRLKALKIADDGEISPETMGDLLSWIADDYRHLYQYEKAIQYLERSRKYLPSMDIEANVDFYYTYCQSLAGLNRLEDAKKMLKELDEYIKSLTNASKYDTNTANLQATKLHGEYAFADKDYDTAIDYYHKYLFYSNELKNEVHIAIAYNKIARVYEKKGNKTSALEYFKLSFEQCMNDGSIDYAFKNANAIAAIYAENNDYFNAYQYSQSAYQLKDSLNASERVKELNFLEAKYQAGQKEKEITELQLKNTQHELNAIKTNRWMSIIGIFFIATIVILSLSYINSRQKRVIAEKDKQNTEKQQQVLSLQAMINGQEKERSRIAKDLHDSMGGTFSTLKMYLSSLEHSSENEEQRNLIGKCIQTVGTAASEMRGIAHNMMPEVLIKFGFIKAIDELANNINLSKQLIITFQHFGIEKSERFEKSFEYMIYRILQELLNNIIKHSDATEAIIQVIREEQVLHITVEDNGKGFKVIKDSIGVGLTSVKERVEYLKGTLSIDSKTMEGTSIMMEFMLKSI
ncbi:MAG: ATP-binding protein [Flavobacterium sp.]